MTVAVHGRTCPTEGCITILSRYNPGPLCFGCEARQHRPQLTKRQRQIVELARRGYDDPQIAEVIGTTKGAIGATISQLRGRGVDVPYRKQRNELKRLMVEAKS